MVLRRKMLAIKVEEEHPKEALTPELRRQKRKEYMKEYYQKNKEKLKEHRREYWRGRYHSDPEFREKALEAARKLRSKYREAYEGLKVELGGKCMVCGNDNLTHLVPHHLHGKEERGIGFILTKEFRDWVRYGIKPDAVLMCANHHLEYEIAKSRGEASDIADFLKLKGSPNP